jgi:anti-sigma B factor antagonist
MLNEELAKDSQNSQEDGRMLPTAGRDVVTIVLRGDLSVQTLSELRETLAQAECCDVVVLDLSAVDYVDSTTLTAFVKLRSRMLDGGRSGTVRIAQPALKVRRIFEICHLDKLFEIYDSIEEAQSA